MYIDGYGLGEARAIRPISARRTRHAIFSLSPLWIGVHTYESIVTSEENERQATMSTIRNRRDEHLYDEFARTDDLISRYRYLT